MKTDDSLVVQIRRVRSRTKMSRIIVSSIQLFFGIFVLVGGILWMLNSEQRIIPSLAIGLVIIATICVATAVSSYEKESVMLELVDLAEEMEKARKTLEELDIPRIKNQED